MGYSYTITGLQHAFITGPNGIGITDLGTLGGAQSAARGINASGQVVGYSEPDHKPVTASRAFITGPNGEGMRDLGTLPASIGGSSSELSSYATGINDAGQVVGGSQKFFDLGYDYGFQLYNTAFITGPNGVGMREIGTAFPSNAHAINSSGQVVGVEDAPPRAPSSGTGFITGPDGKGLTALTSFILTIRPFLVRPFLVALTTLGG